MHGSVEVDAGRHLAVETWGPRDGWPVFLHHGMPGSRLGPRPRERDLELLGIRLIAYDRPGYGRSGRAEGRTVQDAAHDVDRIADALGIGLFSVVGRSGGGPHALACAARLPDRVENAAVLVSLAPPDAEGLSWFEGMAESNIRAFRSARETPEELRGELITRLSGLNADPDRIIADLEPELDPGDLRIVREIAVRTMLIENFRAGLAPEESAAAGADDALAQGSYGWFDDVVALNRPWGFKVDEVTAPVLLWQGELDRFSPIGHFHWLADHVPNVTPVMAPATAHFGAVAAINEILGWLMEPRNRATSGIAGPEVSFTFADRR